MEDDHTQDEQTQAQFRAGRSVGFLFTPRSPQKSDESEELEQLASNTKAQTDLFDMNSNGIN